MSAVCMALPFFFAGVAVSLALTRSPYPIGRVYGVDLLGAATGCLGVLLLLHATDGPSAMLWVAALAAVGAACFAGSGTGEATPAKLPGAAIFGRPRRLCAVLALGALANGLTPYGLRPVALKGHVEDPTADLLFEEWNSFSRVAVFREYSKWPQLWGPSPAAPYDRWAVDQLKLNIDGDAGTVMYRFGGDANGAEFLRYDITNLAYHLPGRTRGAVIGV